MRRRFEHNSKRRRCHSLFQRNPQQFRRSHRRRLRWCRSGLFDDHRRGHRTRHDHLQRQRVRKSHGKEQQCRAAEPRRSALQLRRSGQCLAKRKDAKGGETAERLLALSAEAVDMYFAADDPHRPGVCTAYAAAKADGVTAGRARTRPLYNSAAAEITSGRFSVSREHKF